MGREPVLGGAAALARAPREVVDVAMDMNVDVVTAEKIREILLKKEAAVAREDYDEAKRLKGGIDKLKIVGMKVAQLEAQKQAAVEVEDYDTAKMLKVCGKQFPVSKSHLAQTVHQPPRLTKLLPRFTHCTT